MSDDFPVCETCRFWETSDDSVGICRRHAPQVQFERTYNVPKGHWLQKAHAIWPLVAPDDWCGEYAKGKDATS